MLKDSQIKILKNAQHIVKAFVYVIIAIIFVVIVASIPIRYLGHEPVKVNVEEVVVETHGLEVGQTWLYESYIENPFKEIKGRIYKIIAIKSGYVQYEHLYIENTTPQRDTSSSSIRSFKINIKLIRNK